MKQRLFFIPLLVFCCAALSAQHAEWRDYLENKQYEIIISQAVDLQASDSVDFSKMYLLGQAYEGLLKYKDAYNCYKQCYLLDSTRIEMLNTLARISGNLGRVVEAEKYYGKVLDADSVNFYANYQLGRLYVSLERHFEALFYFAVLLEKDPENSVILRAMGDCYKNLGFLDDAIDCYRNAFKANIENSTLASLLVNTLLMAYNAKENDYANEALAVCDTALFYNPGHKTIRQNKAMTFYVKTEYLKADSMFTALMADRDSSFLTLKFAGCARFHAKNWSDAIEPLEKALEMDDTALDVCLFLGVSHGRYFDIKKAFQYLDRAEDMMKPDSRWSDLLTQFRAEVYIKAGNCNKGAELFYQLWKNNNKQLALLQQILQCYGFQKIDVMPDEDRQRYLFITHLFATEYFQRTNTIDPATATASYLRSTFKKFEEDMFFRSVTSHPMLSPDREKSTLSLEKIKEFSSKLSIK